VSNSSDVQHSPSSRPHSGPDGVWIGRFAARGAHVPRQNGCRRRRRRGRLEPVDDDGRKRTGGCGGGWAADVVDARREVAARAAFARPSHLRRTIASPAAVAGRRRPAPAGRARFAGSRLRMREGVAARPEADRLVRRRVVGTLKTVDGCCRRAVSGRKQAHVVFLAFGDRLSQGRRTDETSAEMTLSFTSSLTLAGAVVDCVFLMVEKRKEFAR